MKLLSRLEAQILLFTQKRPRLSKIEICRLLNEKFKYHCGRRRCFANPRKRRTMVIFPCTCETSLSKVLYALKQLQKRGLIIVRRERKADGKNPRGYDYMKVSYATLKVCFGYI